jgi:cell division protein FtsQ
MRTTDKLWSGQQERKSLPPRHFMYLLLILVTLVASFLFVNSPYFIVGGVLVEGNKYVSVEEVYRIAGIPESVNIFRLNTDDIRHRLTSDLRLSDVEVSRKLPTSIIIRLKERQPLAYIASGYGFVEVDKQGIVLAAFRNLKQVNVPLITGIRLGNVYVGDQIENSQIKNILTYLAALDEATINQLSEINIKSPQQLVAYTTDSITIRIGSNDKMDEKSKLTQAIIQEIHDKKLAVEYVDLNYASPFVKLKQ